MGTDKISLALSGIESQHQTAEKYMAHVRALLRKVDAAYDVQLALPGYYEVKTAVGDQLDVIGALVGSSRRIDDSGMSDIGELDDDIYRQVILAKIIQNQWDGSNDTFKKIWYALLGDIVNATYTDNQDMTMTVTVTGRVSELIEELIAYGLILPKPMGVGMRVDFLRKNNAPVYFGTASQHHTQIDMTADCTVEDLDWLDDEQDNMLTDENGVLLFV